jgi:hypothetical protein
MCIWFTWTNYRSIDDGMWCRNAYIWRKEQKYTKWWGLYGKSNCRLQYTSQKINTTDTVSGDVTFDFLCLSHFLTFCTITHLYVSLEVFIFFAYLCFSICSTHISPSILLTWLILFGSYIVYPLCSTLINLIEAFLSLSSHNQHALRTEF